jgi:hypothetical protein
MRSAREARAGSNWERRDVAAEVRDGAADVVEHPREEAAERREPLDVEEARAEGGVALHLRVHLLAPAQGLPELLPGPRLDEVARDEPLVHRPEDDVEVAVRGQHAAHDAGEARLDDLEQLVAGHAGHALIGDDDGDRVALEELERGLPVLDHADRVLVREGLLEDRAADGIVVHVQDDRHVPLEELSSRPRSPPAGSRRAGRAPRRR